MKILGLREDIYQYIKVNKWEKKWLKSKSLFEENSKHPSLNTELLEPKWRGIYSFRLDKKYRAIFFITENKEVEIIAITNHYKK